MNQAESSIIIIGMLFIVIFIGAVRKKAECILNFILRMVFGTIAIYFFNIAIKKYGMDVYVAINPISVLISGFLGIPGVAVLYGIQFCQIR